MDRLTGLRRADAAIIGGGLTGLLLGASLTDAGMQTFILDAGEGASLASAGVATVQCAPVYARIEATHGLDQACLYAAGLQSQLHALTASPLPYVRPTTVYTYAINADELPLLEKHHQLLNRLQVPVSIAPDAGGCPFPVERSLTAQGQALVDVSRWMAALQVSIRRHGGRIYSDSRVISIDGSRVYTEQGCIQAPLIILTTGMPLGLHSNRLLALLETRTLVRYDLTSHFPLHNCHQSVYEDGLSLRPTTLGVIATCDAGPTGTRRQQERLAQFNRVVSARLSDWQQCEPQYAQDVYPADGLPLIGALPDSRILCATGYSGYGILGSMHAAELLTRRILGRELPEDAIYSPERTLPAPFIRRRMHHKAALYLRSMIRRSAPSCAHCTCRMRYNTPADRWECPYCGSAYTMLGKVIRGPGLRSAQVSPRQRPV